MIARATDALKQTGMVETVERFSLKYVNVVPYQENQSPLAPLQADVKLGHYDLNEYGCTLRTEIPEGEFLNVVQVVPRGTVTVGNESLQGLILDIDTIFVGPCDAFWDILPSKLEDAHDTEQSAFFSVLTTETINAAEPVWEDS